MKSAEEIVNIIENKIKMFESMKVEANGEILNAKNEDERKTWYGLSSDCTQNIVTLSILLDDIRGDLKW